MSPCNLNCQLITARHLSLIVIVSLTLLISASESIYCQDSTTSSSQSSITTTTTTSTTASAPTTRTTTNTSREISESSTTSSSLEQQDIADSNTVNATQSKRFQSAPIISLVNALKSDKRQVLDVYYKFFTKARSHDDQAQKEYVRDGVIKRLKELGFETSFLQKSRFESRHRAAYSYNMISILPGKYRQTSRDRIVLIGAHWDTATKAPGVDDNGSGSTCLLEIARILSENKCSFEHTVMLVWFDYEEQGKYGSEFFVNDYLFPFELHKYGSKFIGAYIMDMILVRDKENNTQTLPVSLANKLTDLKEELEREKYRGDFLATWSRKTYDESLENAFRSSWIDLGYESRTFKAMRPHLPQDRTPTSEERYEWKDFFRSDHASFWFPNLMSSAVRHTPNRTLVSHNISLNAILLTDLGPWRKSYQRCYHSACDDEHLLTDNNLAFMQQVIDSLVLTLLKVGNGECSVTTTKSENEDSHEERPFPAQLIRDISGAQSISHGLGPMLFARLNGTSNSVIQHNHQPQQITPIIDLPQQPHHN